MSLSPRPERLTTMTPSGPSAGASFTACATACELLALSLRYPTPDLIDIVANQDWVGAAREIADALGMELPAGWGDDLGEVELHSFRAEATHLMVGAPTPQKAAAFSVPRESSRARSSVRR